MANEVKRRQENSFASTKNPSFSLPSFAWDYPYMMIKGFSGLYEIFMKFHLINWNLKKKKKKKKYSILFAVPF